MGEVMKKYSLIDLVKYLLFIVPVSYILGMLIVFIARCWEFFI